MITKKILSVVLMASVTLLSEAFVRPCCKIEKTPSLALFAERTQPNGFVGAISNFFDELDAFVDDAANRRLGNGAKFYGKRRSNFYGAGDTMKKVDKDVFDPQGALSFSNLFWCFFTASGLLFSHIFIVPV